MRNVESSRLHPPFAQPGRSRAGQHAETIEVLPSIQDFVDDLPSIDEYLLSGDIYSGDNRDIASIDDYLHDSPIGADDFAETPHAPDFDDDGWAIADWQSFDWSGAAMLGSRGEEATAPARSKSGAASPADRPRSREITPSADEVARALDGIAERIRSGELLIDQLTGAPPEAAMAAALAALLRMRD